VIIWALLDGKKGHYVQLSALIDAMTCTLDTEVSWFPKNKIPDIRNYAKPDLIICAGHGTHLKALIFRAIFGGRVAVLMKPSLPLTWFDFCITPEHDRLTGRDNVLSTVGPINSLSPDCKDKELPDVVFLGGYSKGFYWDEFKINLYIENIVSISERELWVVGSRRTPASTLRMLNETKKTLQVPMRVFSANDLPSDWVSTKLPKLEKIWVTQDSANMIYEGLTVKACVGLIPLKPRGKGKLSSSLNELIKEKWVRCATLDGEPLSCSTLSPPSLKEANRAAAWLISKL